MQDFKSERIKALQADLALLVVTMVWGATFVMVKEAVAVFPVFAFLALRFALAVLTTAPLLLIGQSNPIKSGELAAGCLVGLFLFAGYSLQTWGLRYTTSARAGFITGLSVVIVPVLSAVVLRRRPERGAIVGVALAVLGLGLLSWQGGLAPSLGDLLILGCAFAFASHIVALGKFAPEMRPLPLTFGQLVAVALLSSLLAGFLETPLPRLKGHVLGAAAFTGVLATTFAFGVQTAAQRFTSPTHTALIFAMEPVFAALFGFLLAGETLGLREGIGCLCILAGMVISEA